MTHLAAPGDSLRITARNVTDSDDGPVTADLDGVLTLIDYDSEVEITDDNYTGPYALDNPDADEQWLADFLAPAVNGHYRARLVLIYNDAQRTLDVDLTVAAPVAT